LPAADRLQVMGRLLWVLVQANTVDIRSRPPSSSVKIVPGGLTWQDAARAVEAGQMTCPSAVAWRVAELRKAGENALWVTTVDGRLLVQRANGQREDVCKGVAWADALTTNAVWTPTLELTSFESTPAAKKMTVICKMLDVLHTANVGWIKAGNRVPPIYQSGLRYKEEQLGKDEWQDIPRTLFLGDGDCEDLASYRVSELRAGGEAAEHTVEHRRSPTLVLYHIRVKRQNGDIEDPSCALGMGGACANLVPAAKAAQQLDAPQSPDMTSGLASVTRAMTMTGGASWAGRNLLAEHAVLAAF
jgi:hypothetical protein